MKPDCNMFLPQHTFKGLKDKMIFMAFFWGDEETYTGNDINGSFSSICKTNHRNFLTNNKETKGSGSLGMCQMLHFAVRA